MAERAVVSTNDLFRPVANLAKVFAQPKRTSSTAQLSAFGCKKFAVDILVSVGRRW
jgi:hypothetical protein